MNVAEEVDDVFGTRQQRQIAEDDDAVEAVVYKDEQKAKEPQKRFPRSSSTFVGTTRSSDRGLREFKISNVFWLVLGCINSQ